MPDLPALPLGSPSRRQRITRGGPRPRLQGPGPARQQDRLGDSLRRLTDLFAAGNADTTSQPAADPEQVLVFEIAGEVTDFVKAVGNVPGLEFLAEEAQDRLEPDEDFAAVGKDDRRHPYDRQLYLVISDTTAWQQLLGLWDDFQSGKSLPRGLAPFGHLFSRLKTLRPWDDRDRLERSGALEAWAAELDGLRDDLVEFEIELFLRQDERKRDAALLELRTGIEAHRGSIIASSVRPEIGYHGVLARVPARFLIDSVASHQVRWLRTGGVRFFHAVGQFAAVAADPDDSTEGETQGAVTEARPGQPRIAVLDGVPMGGHTLLRDRIVLDDPEDWEALSPAERRRHGTGMASVVVHGDLNASQRPQPVPIYVRPILWDQSPSWVQGGREELPRDRLAVDLLHEAIVRLYEGEAVAPAVRVVVIAVGDAVCQFDRFVSPLARLLDWLSARFGILLLVSAGNHLEDLTLHGEVDGSNIEELQHEVLCALQRSAGLRRLLSPAESVNALTIGAAHSDSVTALGDDGRLDPILTADLPNVSSALGGGIRRAVKPDLLLPGGRQLLARQPATGTDGRRFTITATRRPPGVRMAAPSVRPGQVDATWHDTGTSVATALAGYYAGHLLEDIDGLRRQWGSDMPPSDLDAVLVKAALVHGARWGTARALIDPVAEETAGRRSRQMVARMVGYGRSSPEQVLRCDDHRVTAFSAGTLVDGAADAYRFPLPASLASRTALRRLTITLAWLTPINPEHRAYRRAALAVEPGGLPNSFGERMDVGAYDGRRGTVQHAVLEGRRAVPYAPSKTIELVVSCRADAGVLEAAVPYALFVTLEVPQGIQLPIYQEVRQGLRVPVAIRSA